MYKMEIKKNIFFYHIAKIKWNSVLQNKIKRGISLNLDTHIFKQTNRNLTQSHLNVNKEREAGKRRPSRQSINGSDAADTR